MYSTLNQMLWPTFVLYACLLVGWIILFSKRKLNIRLMCISSIITVFIGLSIPILIDPTRTIDGGVFLLLIKRLIIAGAYGSSFLTWWLPPFRDNLRAIHLCW